MSGLSTFLQSAVLNWIKGTAMPTPPETVYVALFSADPTDAASLSSEVTTTVRVAGRVPASFGAINTASGTGTIANSAAVEFGAADSGVAVTHFGLFDSASGGNMLGSGSVSGGAITAGSVVSFASGALSIALS